MGELYCPGAEQKVGAEEMQSHSYLRREVSVSAQMPGTRWGQSVSGVGRVSYP